MLFNSKHDQCRGCFDFCFLLLIWSTTAEKILKLSLFLLTCLSSCIWKLTQGPKIKYHKKCMLFSVKYMICGRMKKESSNLKTKDRHLNQKTIRSRWVIRFCWWIRYFLWKGFCFATNVKNACQPFHVECQVLVRRKINISLISLLYNCEWTLNNKDSSKVSKKLQENN